MFKLTKISYGMNKGLTVLEILFGLAILALAVTIILLSFTKLNSSQTLEKSASLVTSILEEARSLTLSSRGGAQYGVYFEDSQITLFKGAIYSPLDLDNVVTPLNPSIGIRNVNLSGGGASVIFKRLTGYTDEDGSVEVFLRSSTSTSITINITGTGIVE